MTVYMPVLSFIDNSILFRLLCGNEHRAHRVELTTDAFARQTANERYAEMLRRVAAAGLFPKNDGLLDALLAED